jgi:hypothetical protein
VSAHPSARRIVAHEARVLKLPPDAKCEHCGETDLVVLRGGDPVMCFDCAAISEGRSVIEHHHVGGRPSPIVAPVSRNVHARLTLIQDLTWRALGALPGSPEVILIDLLALQALGGEHLA